MDPMVNSPNWGWALLGYTIERPTRYKRKIYDTNGKLVLDCVGYDAEVSYLKNIGIICSSTEDSPK